MRIAFLSSGQPDSRATWSGTPFFCLRALREHFETVEPIGSPSFRLLLRGLRRGATRMRIDAAREPVVGHLYALALRRRLERFRPDVVFGLASSTQLYGLVDDFNVVHCSDATFRVMRDYYPDWFSGLSQRGIRNGESMEARVIRGARLSLYPSEWAANSARTDYGAFPDRVHTVPFGANLDDYPDADTFQRRDDTVCRLLFVGVEWDRKGGALALAVLRALQGKGIQAELHVVGCAPPEEARVAGLVAHGFLSKNDPAQRRLLQSLFANAAFLIVPSRQEAYGLVFCEASAYGLPSLATVTGGIPTIVKQGENGFVFPLDAGPDPYVQAIVEYWTAPQRYARLRRSTRLRGCSELTWKAWGARSADLIRNAVKLAPDAQPRMRGTH
jgi:glycosyltransferase involved in cell wall biosynthesis